MDLPVAPTVLALIERELARAPAPLLAAAPAALPATAARATLPAAAAVAALPAALSTARHLILLVTVPHAQPLPLRGTARPARSQPDR
jgi:hypothetical protein